MRDLLAAVNRDERVVNPQRPQKRSNVARDLRPVEFACEGRVDIVHLSGLDDQHRADVFLALKEMPAVGCLRADETREVQRVVGIREYQEVFFGTTHAASVACAIDESDTL